MNLSTSKNVVLNEQASTKLPYAQPAVEKHGNIESLTQFIKMAPSGPIHHGRD